MPLLLSSGDEYLLQVVFERILFNSSCLNLLDSEGKFHSQTSTLMSFFSILLTSPQKIEKSKNFIKSKLYKSFRTCFWSPESSQILPAKPSWPYLPFKVERFVDRVPRQFVLSTLEATLHWLKTLLKEETPGFLALLGPWRQLQSLLSVFYSEHRFYAEPTVSTTIEFVLQQILRENFDFSSQAWSQGSTSMIPQIYHMKYSPVLTKMLAEYQWNSYYDPLFSRVLFALLQPSVSLQIRSTIFEELASVPIGTFAKAVGSEILGRKENYLLPCERNNGIIDTFISWSEELLVLEDNFVKHFLLHHIHCYLAHVRSTQSDIVSQQVQQMSTGLRKEVLNFKPEESVNLPKDYDAAVLPRVCDLQHQAEF